MVPLTDAKAAAERVGWPLQVVDKAAHAPPGSHPQVTGHLTHRLRAALVAEVRDSAVAAAPAAAAWAGGGVMAVVLDYARIVFFRRRRVRCRVMRVDEKSLLKGHGGFSTIVSDAETGPVVAVLPGRSGRVLERFLARQSRSWREGVQVVVTDMASCYRGAVVRRLPGAARVVDRFHVVRNVMAVVVEARRAAQRSERGQPHDPAVFRGPLHPHAPHRPPQRHRHGRAGRPLRPPPPPGRGPGRWPSASTASMRPTAARRHGGGGRVRRRLGADPHRHGLGRAQPAAVGGAGLRLPRPRAGTSASAEGVNNRIEVLERKAYGFRSRMIGRRSFSPAAQCSRPTSRGVTPPAFALRGGGLSAGSVLYVHSIVLTPWADATRKGPHTTATL
jgi:hypothetical protein